MVSDIAADRCYDQAVAPRPPMSEEQLKAFLEKVNGDTALMEKLQAAADSDAVLAIAKEAGFMISAEDLKKAQSALSDKELEGAAGGANGGPNSKDLNWKVTRCGWCTMDIGDGINRCAP